MNAYHNAYLGNFHCGLNTGVATFQESGVSARGVVFE